MFLNIKKFSIQFITFVFLSLFLFQQAWAIGVSPSIMEYQDLANNLVIEKTVFLSRANPSQNEYYKVSVEGPAASAIVLSTTAMTLPKGQRQVPFKFQIKPVALSNGEYRAFLVFSGSVPEDEVSDGKNSVAFLTGVTAQITFTISDKEVKKFEIVEIYPDQTEVDQPFVLSFTLKNVGNVNARPDRIELAFMDRTDPTHIIRETVDKDRISFVGPQKSEKVVVQLQSKVPQGKYDLEVKFYSDDVLIFTQKIIQEIFPKGSLAQKIEFTEFKTNKERYGVGETVRFSGVAKNNGEVATESLFVIEVSKDGQPLDIKRSDKQLILKTEQGTFPASFVPDEKGTYHVKAYFEFGVKKTEYKELDFVVGTDKTLMYIIAGSSILILFIILIIFFIKRNKKDGNNQPPAPQAPVVPPQPVQPPVAPQVGSTVVSPAAPVAAIPAAPVAPSAPVVPPSTPNNQPKV